MGEHAVRFHAVLVGEFQVLDGLLLELGAVLGDERLRYAVGHFLDFGIDGAVDGDAVGIERVLPVLLFHVLADFFVVVEARTLLGFLFGEHDGGRYVLVVVFLADVARVVHRVKDGVAALERCLGVAVGAVRFGCLEHTGEDCVFRNGETVERMPEVVFACRLETVVATAQVDLVHVELEDFLLGVGLFDADGGHRLFDFTGDGTFRREEQEFGQLLGEGGGAAELLAAEGALDDCRRDSPDVHAPVVVEGAVLGRHDGVNRVFGDGVETDPFAAFHEVLVRNLPVHVVDVCHEFRVDLLELREGREFRQVVVVDYDDSDEPGNHREA